MSRTFGGMVFYGAADILIPQSQLGTGAGQNSLVRNAAGDWSINNGAGAATLFYTADNSTVKRPNFSFPAFPGQGTVLTSNEYQELFGTAAGGPGNPFSGNQSGTQFGTPAIPWGISIVDIFVVYSVVTANLTSATLGLNRLTFAEGVANVVTQVVAPTAIALTTTGGATTCHVQKVALAQPLAYESTDFSDLNIEVALGAAGTSAIRVYGIGAHMSVEYS